MNTLSAEPAADLARTEQLRSEPQATRVMRCTNTQKETNRMKKLLLTLAALVFAFANVSEAGKGNIPIAPFQIAQSIQSIQSIAQAIQSAKEPIHNSKPVTTPASKKKRTASRSSRKPSLATASNESSALVST